MLNLTSRPADPEPPPARGNAVSLKVVIAGGFGVGKTTAVGAVSEIPPLQTEEYLSEPSALVDSLEGVAAKTTTTVAFDFGRLSLTDPLPLELLLFGAPGQDRFLGVWHDLARGAIGAVVLVDTRRLDTSFMAVNFFEDNRLPFVVAVNEFDGARRYHPEDVRTALELDPRVPVMTCDARDPDQVAAVLLALVGHAVNTTSATHQDAR
ncbi:ATP-binding protein [Streptomyces sp. SID8381]|uniref:GTP-binding protein n=1 Tax=unclassified Streptomyces TaxID=2593676 RepID=UPI0003A5F178|nr:MULTISPECIES: ATP/GTP-binding protein [unclassified Streptomyces]MYX27452.1 ATP-binding protein [Streptomyces sp. SID8381]